MKDFLINKAEEIFEEYSKVNVISKFDVFTILYAYEYFNIKNFIPGFFEALAQNKLHEKIEMSELVHVLVKYLDNDIGTPIMQSISSYMFKEMTSFKKGTLKLVKAQVVTSKLSAEVLNAEQWDKKAFFITDDQVPPIDIIIWKWNYKFHLNTPSKTLYQFLSAFSKYLVDDHTVLKEDKVNKLINYLWQV